MPTGAAQPVPLGMQQAMRVCAGRRGAPDQSLLPGGQRKQGTPVVARVGCQQAPTAPVARFGISPLPPQDPRLDSGEPLWDAKQRLPVVCEACDIGYEDIATRTGGERAQHGNHKPHPNPPKPSPASFAARCATAPEVQSGRRQARWPARRTRGAHDSGPSGGRGGLGPRRSPSRQPPSGPSPPHTGTRGRRRSASRRLCAHFVARSMPMPAVGLTHTTPPTDETA